MKQYGLGPNGGIVTALNLFATKFDQVAGCLYVLRLLPQSLQSYFSLEGFKSRG